MDPMSTMRSKPSEVIENFLYLGSKANSQDGMLLNALGITHILNVTPDMPNVFQTGSANMRQISYLRVEFDDIKNDTRLLGVLPQAIDFINCAKANHGKVLVHCYLGASRSPAIVLAYLVSTRVFTLLDACNLVKGVRPDVQPNLGFFEQLIMYERHVYGRSSLVVSDYSKFFNTGYLNGEIDVDVMLKDVDLNPRCLIS